VGNKPKYSNSLTPPILGGLLGVKSSVKSTKDGKSGWGKNKKEADRDRKRRGR
jgi:hypothetical protein